MLHIRLPAELHKRLRIRAAEDDSTLQDWVLRTIQGELDRKKKRSSDRCNSVSKAGQHAA